MSTRACSTRPTVTVKVAASTKFGILQRQDRAAVADRREREHAAAGEPEQRRAHTAGRSRLERHHHHAGRRDQDGDRHGQRQLVAEEDEPEQGDLYRLGLEIGDGDDEGALAHRGEHEPGCQHLSQRTVEHPRPERPARLRQRPPGREQDAGKKHERERKAEQEAHMGGADRAEARGQLALHGVARGLAGRGNQREHRPEPGAVEHYPGMFRRS